MLLASAGVNYLMGIPMGDDVMLNYQTTSFHNNAALRELYGFRPTPEFEAWLERMGLWRNGKLTERAGDPIGLRGRVRRRARHDRGRSCSALVRRGGEGASSRAARAEGPRRARSRAAPTSARCGRGGRSSARCPPYRAARGAVGDVEALPRPRARAGPHRHPLPHRELPGPARRPRHRPRRGGQPRSPTDWAEQQGWLPLKTRAKDHQEYLLHPDQGRRLDDASRAALRAAGRPGRRRAAHRRRRALRGGADGERPGAGRGARAGAARAAGFTVGKPLFVQLRPHRRAGRDRRAHPAPGPRSSSSASGPASAPATRCPSTPPSARGSGQDNSEKDCISNVRALGFPPEPRRGAKCAELMKRTFAAGGGGVKLIGGQRTAR